MAYSNVIVQGTSFALHKFDAFRASQETDSRAAWSEARSVDSLIAATAGIAFFGFATLWSFGLLPIRELGIASALGVAWVFVLAVFFLPAFHLLGGEHTAVSAETQSNRLFVWCDAVLDRLVSGCVRLAVWLSQGKRPGAVILCVCGLFALVAVLFSQGHIVSRTRALQFIRGTLVEKEAQFLNQPGNIGFEFFDLLVEPGERLAAQQADNAIDDPHFLRRAWEFHTSLKNIPQAREISSILSTVHHIARESFHKDFPDTEEEVGSTFFLIENGFVPSVQRQLYFPGGVRISVSYSMDDSIELGQFSDAILALARNEFADLTINAFNTAPLYPQVDKHVRWGKINNVFSSQIGVAFICGLLIMWRNTQLRHTQLSAVRGGVVMSMPLFFATAFVGLLMWLFDIPLDMSTAVMGALTINAATDFSLYLAMTYHQALETHSPEDALPVALRREGKVIIADCVLNILCFLPLISSRFLPVRQIGWVMGVMLLTCAVATLIFMAALLPHCVKKKEAKEALI
jgi:predicted RND superfamily exporter protein